jgi:hypothetical protein
VIEGVNTTALSAHRTCTGVKLGRGEPTVPTTVARELEINPFFNAKDAAAFAHWRRLRDSW